MEAHKTICFGPVRLTSTHSRLGSERKNHMSENLGGPRTVDKSMAENLNISNWRDVGGLAKAISIALWNVAFQ